MNRFVINLLLLCSTGFFVALLTGGKADSKRGYNNDHSSAAPIQLNVFPYVEKSQSVKYVLGGGPEPTPTPVPTPTPIPTVSPCQCPESSPDESTKGLIKCDSAQPPTCTPNICTWITPEQIGGAGSSPGVLDDVIACIRAHEQVHLDDPNSGCGEGYWGASTDFEANQSECNAYTASYACLSLILGIDEFRNDQYSKAEFFCGQAVMPVPTRIPHMPNTDPSD